MLEGLGVLFLMIVIGFTIYCVYVVVKEQFTKHERKITYMDRLENSFQDLAEVEYFSSKSKIQYLSTDEVASILHKEYERLLERKSEDGK